MSKAADTSGRVSYREGEAPWSEDEQFEECAKACKSRCKQYGYTCGQGGEEDYEYEGQCDECDHDAQEVLQKKYAHAIAAAKGGA